MSLVHGEAPLSTEREATTNADIDLPRRTLYLQSTPILRSAARFVVVFVLVLAAAVSACDDSPVRFDLVDLEGDWIGTAEGFVLSLTLVETSTGLSGSGELTGPDDSFPLTVEGGRSEEDVTLTLSAAELEPIQFTGEILSADILRGKLDGAGFFGDEIALMRD